MLHGLADNALSWNCIPLLLEVEYDVVLVDARGHGMSGLDARGAGLDVQADDVTSLIEQLHLIKPVLIGHSMGAALAALLAARLPKVIHGAVLIDPPWRDEAELVPSNGKERYDEAFREGVRKIKETNLEVLMAKGRAENPGWDDSEFSQWAKAKQQFNLEHAQYRYDPRLPLARNRAAVDLPGLADHRRYGKRRGDHPGSGGENCQVMAQGEVGARAACWT